MTQEEYLAKIFGNIEEIRKYVVETKEEISQIKKDIFSLKEDMRKVLRCVSTENADFQLNNL